MQVLIYEDNAAGFSMLFDDDGEQFRHVIGEGPAFYSLQIFVARYCVSSKSLFAVARFLAVPATAMIAGCATPVVINCSPAVSVGSGTLATAVAS